MSQNSQPYPRVQILTVAELLKDPHRPNPACLQVPGGSGQHTLPEPARHHRPGVDEEELFEQ